MKTSLTSLLTASAALAALLIAGPPAPAQTHGSSSDRQYHRSDRAFHSEDARFHAADRTYHHSRHHTAAQVREDRELHRMDRDLHGADRNLHASDRTYHHGTSR